MHGFCGILGLEADKIDKRAFAKSINLADTMHVDLFSDESFFSVVSFLDSSPLKGQRIYKTNDLIFLFTGDLIGYKEIPWEDVERNFLNSNFEWFLTLRGLFAFAIFNKKSKQMSLISDHRAQLPVYYGYLDNNFVFSTDLSTFTTLKTVPEFNIKWLYEYMFFNSPIDSTTFLKGVNRLRPISILNFNLESKIIKESKYGEYFKKAKYILTGKEALDINIKAFKERIPKYYSEEKITLTAISGGFDSRTLLALAPEKARVKTYTYGVKGSGDLNVVSTFINKLNIDHKEIFFDEKFKKSLPSLIYDTVRLSGGTQPILRSTLLYVYRNLYKDNNSIPIVIGGINGDFYRGWDFPTDPSILSSGMNQFFKTGKINIDKAIDIKMFKNDSDDFKKYINNVVNGIEDRFGNPKKPESRMSFNIYETAPKYFGGEIAIASNFFTPRQPFWDIDLVDLTFKTECSYLGFFKRLKEKKDTTYKQYVLQTKVIANNPVFKKTYINGMPLSLFTIDNKFLFQVGRLFIRGFAYLRGYREPENDLEEWGDWFQNNLKDEFDRLLNDKSLILEYINNDLVHFAKEKNDIHLLNKFATTEIILNLIKRKWDLFQ